MTSGLPVEVMPRLERFFCWRHNCSSVLASGAEAAQVLVPIQDDIDSSVLARCAALLVDKETVSIRAYVKTAEPARKIWERLGGLIWIILHNGVHDEERSPSVCEKAKRVRTSRMIRTLRTLGYRVEPAAILASGGILKLT